MRTNTEKTLTSANSILQVRAKGFNDNWVKLEQYAADNAFDYGYQQAFKQIDTLRRLISE